MPQYQGQYLYDGKLTNGTLFTHAVYKELNRPWGASFSYDKTEVPGVVSVLIVSESDHLDTEQQALAAAEERGFVLQSKEGE